jgi:DNA-binding response OmpR family regulator
MNGEPPGAQVTSAEEVARVPVVLIAEDEEPIAEALAYVVQDAGYRAVVAVDGKAALELAHAHRPDLIITDLMMPLMGGEEFIRALRETWQGTPPPVVLMTAAGPRYAEAAGSDALLLKPFELKEVEELLCRFLATR